jgi:hypothetical protein
MERHEIFTDNVSVTANISALSFRWPESQGFMDGFVPRLT